MPTLKRLGSLAGRGLSAALVRCDGVDGRPAEEGVESDRVWFVLRGRFALTGSRGRRAGDPATALLLGGDEPFCIRHPDGCGDLCLSISGDLARQAVDRGGIAAPVPVAAWLRLRSLAVRLAHSEPVEPLELEEAMWAALEPAAGPLAAAAGGGATARERGIAHAVAHEVAMRFDERLSLGELAAPLGVSVFALCRAFRRARRATVHATLQRLRLRHALALMLDTDWTLARIAAECGFASHSHLTTRMRRELGETPSALRRGPERARAGASTFGR